jgi:hypothetical protein
MTASNALSLVRRKRPPVLPSAAKALFNVRNVVAAPQSDCRNARRPYNWHIEDNLTLLQEMGVAKVGS